MPKQTSHEELVRDYGPPPPGGSGVQPSPTEQRAESWLDLAHSLATEAERTLRAFTSACADMAAAAQKFVEVYKLANIRPEQLHPELGTCDECGEATRRRDLFPTPWDSKVCRTCWDDVTNGAPLPEPKQE